MRYSYDYKRKAVELYRLGLWPDTPDGLDTITMTFYGKTAPDSAPHTETKVAWEETFRAKKYCQTRRSDSFTYTY